MSVPLLKIPISTKGCETFIKEGDTIGVIEFDLSPEFQGDLTADHRIRMQLFRGAVKEADFSSQSMGITITGATTFEIDEIPENTFKAGTLIGDLQIEEYLDFAEDPINVTTYFNVEYKIVKEYTKRP